MGHRFDQCDETCTVDCGHCKGRGPWNHTLSLRELRAMPTIEVGHTDDLKFESPYHRIWLSRMTEADGVKYGTRQVTVERRSPSSGWENARTYRAGGSAGE